MYKLYIVGRYVSDREYYYDIRFEITDANGNPEPGPRFPGDPKYSHRFHWLERGSNGEKWYVANNIVVRHGDSLSFKANAGYNGFTISDQPFEDKGSTNLGHGAYLGTGSLLNYNYGNPTITLVKNSGGKVAFTANTFAFFQPHLELYGNVYIVLGEMHYTLDGTEPTANSTNKKLIDNEEKSITITNQLKVKYFTFINKPNPKGEVYTISGESPVSINSPTLNYVRVNNLNDDYISITKNSDNPEVITKAYTKTVAGDIDREIINNRILVSTLINTTSFKNFIERYNIFAVNKTNTQSSEEETLDLFIAANRTVAITPVVRVENNTAKFDIDDCTNEAAQAWYTLDGTTPARNGSRSTKYEGPFMVPAKLNGVVVTHIKVIYVIGNIKTQVKDYLFDFDESPEIVKEYGEPDIKLNGFENKPLVKPVLKRYVDIIYNRDFNIPKVLNSLRYILNKIESQYSSINVSEEYLNRRFGGDYIAIYSDECYTGILDVKHYDEINRLNDYKLPYWDRGAWNFNYFRNDIIRDVTENELQTYCTIIYYDPNTGVNTVRRVNLDKLKEANLYNAESDKAVPSDNRGLVYGKYFVARFIFDDTARIKFDELSFNTNTY